MTYTTISLSINERGIAILTLDRAEKHNALSAVMIAELTTVAGKLAQDASVRAVILAASGKTFCAGGDLAWMKEQMTATRSRRIEEARKLAEMLYQLNALPKPLIGKIHGNAFGGGVGMMSVCDIIFSSKNAMFGLTETKLGLIPATIGPYVVARIGEPNARQVALSAKLFSADEARDLGLVSKVVDDLDAEVEAEANRYLAVAPAAVAASKALVQSLGARIDADVIDQTIKRLADTWEHPEAEEGISAFFEKRRPSWIG